MLFQKNENLEELIVLLLAQRPGLCVKDIGNLVNKFGRTYSIAAVYKELNKLLQAGVLVKISRCYSLSLTWTLHLLSLSQSLEENYVKRPSTTLVLPEEGSRVRYKFTSLLRVNDFSSHVVLLLVAKAKEKTVYSWNPHPWFYLAQTEQETGYLRGLRIAGGKFLKVIGGDTFLDHWTKRFWRDDATQYAFSPTGFENDRQLCYNVVDDFIASFRLDAAATAMIDALYLKVQNIKDLQIPELFDLFQRRCRAAFHIEHNPIKAARYRRKFLRFFGQRTKR
jgi:hypothetical protein